MVEVEFTRKIFGEALAEYGVQGLRHHAAL